MAALRLLSLESRDDIRRHAAAWDRLWLRSDVTVPTARAETVAIWIERFAPRARLRVVAVEEDGQWLAALPLVGRRLRGCFPVASLPTNEWLSSGDLMIDPDAGGEALAALVDGLRRLPWPLLWLDNAEIDSPRWRALTDALRRAGAACEVREHLRVGRLSIDGDWPAYRAGWSRRHRQRLASARRRLEAIGPVSLRRVCPDDPREVESWLRLAFAIEQRGWKGAAGTAVLSTPGMFAFFLAEARQLAAWKQLELAFLEVDGLPRAFSITAKAKGVVHSCKIGYEAALKRHSPGQVLRAMLLESLFCDHETTAIDFQGPLTESHRAWHPESYAIGRLAAATRFTGRAALALYRRLLRPAVALPAEQIPSVTSAE